MMMREEIISNKDDTDSIEYKRKNLRHVDRLEGETKSSCLSAIIRMERQSQLVRPRDDCSDCRVPVEPVVKLVKSV